MMPPKGLAGFVSAAVLAISMTGYAQPVEWTLSVNGLPIDLPRPITRTGNDFLIPLFPVTQALGFEIEAAPDVDGFRVRRGGGIDVIYDGRTGEIRLGPVIAGQLKDFKQVAIVGPVEELLFPLNGLITLLAVDFQQDPDRNVLRITSSGGSSTFTSIPAAGFSSMDYSAGITAAGGSNGQYAMLHSEGVAGGASLKSNFLLSGTGSTLGFRQGNVIVYLNRGRSLSVGDQSTISGIDSMTSFVRGVGYAAPVKGFQTTAYAGRAAGTVYAALGAPGVARYDSTIVGSTVRRVTARSELAFAANDFSGPERQGTGAGAAFFRKSSLNQFRAQGVFGTFSGLSLRTSTVIPNPTSSADNSQIFPQPIAKTPVRGAATGISLFDAFSPIKRLTITGQFDRYGKNFLTAREDSQFDAQTSQHVSVTFQPLSNLSLFGRTTRRKYLLGDSNLTHGFDYAASGTIPKVRFLQFNYFRSVQDERNSSFGRLGLSQYSVSVLNLDQFFGTAMLSDIRFGQVATRTITWTLTRNFTTIGQFGLHGQDQVNSVQRYGGDWQVNIPHSKGAFRIGMDHLNTNGGSYVPLAGLNFPLPGGQRLQLMYSAEPNTHMFTLVIGGPVIRREDVREDTDGRIKIAQTASLDGFVYFDSDGNNVYETAKDAPMADITVWLDDDVSVRTDARGYFRFHDVKTGAHVIRADISNVPADMTFEGTGERHVAVLPFRSNNQDFAIVRTGAVSGKLMYLDYSRDPENPVERALGDGRIIADSEHDTYSDIGGSFTLGGLPPGKYLLKIDAETVPEGYLPSPAQIEVLVKPAETLRNLRILLARPPKPTIIKDLPVQQTQRAAAAESPDPQK
jgi:hypothetical protein